MIILAAKKQIAMNRCFLFMDVLRYHGRTRSIEKKSLRANKDSLSFSFPQTKTKCFAVTQGIALNQNEVIL
jgi:hypothetical protein